ncbi:MAG: hypothetical protein OQL19_22205 [Gammaproteobacteria bacterium]|nr:hypothetical protein [Gammaproteobacteria bacterium]
MSEINSSNLLFLDKNLQQKDSSFNQKQGWLNELEKAQKLISDSDKFSQSKKEAVEQEKNLNSVDIKDSSIVLKKSDFSRDITRTETHFISDSFASPNFMNSNESLRTHKQVLLQQSELMPNSNKMLNNELVQNKQILRKQNLENLMSRLSSEYKIQSLNFVLEKSGVKILFRDYRMENKDINKMIERIKKSISKLGVPITNVLVNGNIYTKADVL